MMTRQMELIDTLLAGGQDEFTFREAKAVLGVSPSATANALRQLGEKGLVDRLIRGHYAIRPLGSAAAPTCDAPRTGCGRGRGRRRGAGLRPRSRRRPAPSSEARGPRTPGLQG